jgi:hypothetical protein
MNKKKYMIFNENVSTTKRLLKPFFVWHLLYVARKDPVEVSEFITSALTILHAQIIGVGGGGMR